MMEWLSLFYVQTYRRQYDWDMVFQDFSGLHEQRQGEADLALHHAMLETLDQVNEFNNFHNGRTLGIHTDPR